MEEQKTDGGQPVAKCAHCGSTNVFGISRVVGYYGMIENWNKGKLAELKDRQKGNYSIPKKVEVKK